MLKKVAVGNPGITYGLLSCAVGLDSGAPVLFQIYCLKFLLVFSDEKNREEAWLSSFNLVCNFINFKGK